MSGLVENERKRDGKGKRKKKKWKKNNKILFIG